MHPYTLIEQGIKHTTILTNNNLPRASPRSQMLWFFSVKCVINRGLPLTCIQYWIIIVYIYMSYRFFNMAKYRVILFHIRFSKKCICVFHLIIIMLSDYELSWPLHCQACRLVGAKPLPEPILLIRNFGTTFSELHIFVFKKCIWKCRLRNGGNFVSALMC